MKVFVSLEKQFRALEKFNKSKINYERAIDNHLSCRFECCRFHLVYITIFLLTFFFPFSLSRSHLRRLSFYLSQSFSQRSVGSVLRITITIKPYPISHAFYMHSSKKSSQDSDQIRFVRVDILLECRKM